MKRLWPESLHRNIPQVDILIWQGTMVFAFTGRYRALIRILIAIMIAASAIYIYADDRMKVLTLYYLKAFSIYFAPVLIVLIVFRIAGVRTAYSFWAAGLMLIFLVSNMSFMHLEFLDDYEPVSYQIYKNPSFIREMYRKDGIRW